MSTLTESGAQVTLEEYTGWLEEIREQPEWRRKADREMDYCDGNQLDSEILERMKALGIPPAVEPLMGPTIDGVLGLEVKSRGDWKVIPDSQADSDEVADALNYKLHQAEAKSGADVACSNAFAPQIKVGAGWAHVTREQDPFRYPYLVEDVHRNEIFWDWYAKPDLSNARFLVRRKWFDKEIPKLMFPGKADLIEGASGGWLGMDYSAFTGDADGLEIDLFASADQERGWPIEDQDWRDINRRRVCLMECWYRRWERALVI
jgi:hypothetical protein